MRKLKYYVACTVDGFIAHKDGSFDGFLFQMKVLYTSGYTDDAILRHGVLDKATHFIGKPYPMAELTRKVRDVLDS